MKKSYILLLFILINSLVLSNKIKPPVPVSDAGMINKNITISHTLKDGNIQPGIMKSLDEMNINQGTVLERRRTGTKAFDPRQYNLNTIDSPSAHAGHQIRTNAESRNEFLSNGNGVQITKSVDGKQWYCVSTYDTDITDYRMIKVHYTGDDGYWYYDYFYYTDRDMLHPDIEVIDDRYVIIYQIDSDDDTYGDLGYVWGTISGEFQFQFGLMDPVSDGYEHVWFGSITSDKFYYTPEWVYLYVTFAISEWDDYEGWIKNIYYIASGDYGNSWSTPVKVTDEQSGQDAVRPGISIAFGTSEAGTEQDYIYTTWRDSLWNGYCGRIDFWTEEVSTNIVLPSFDSDDGWYHQAPSVSAYYGEVFITSVVHYGVNMPYGNANSDISCTFSYDNGNTWGEDYLWYYWIDEDDITEYNASSAWGDDGTLGFAWLKSDNYSGNGEILYRWRGPGGPWGFTEPISIANDILWSWMVGSSIVGSTYTIVYDRAAEDQVFYNFSDLGGPTNSLSIYDLQNSYDINETVNVTWETTGTITNVDVSLSDNGGQSWSIIADGIDNNNSYSWFVNPDLVDNNNVQLKVASSEDEDINDISNSISVDPTNEPHVISVEDTPNDNGHFIDIHFTRSKFDGSQNGAEIYTVYREMEGGQWQATNSLDADGSSINLVLGTTFEIGSPTNFKISATMAEGTFESDEFHGTSMDNIAPATPSSRIFTVNGNQILLSWDPNQESDLAYYSIYSGSDQTNMNLISYTIETSTQLDYTTSWIYGITATDHHGNESEMGIFSETLDIDDLAAFPVEYKLFQNYPNPFNPMTTIRYDLQDNGLVNVAIYNMKGLAVKTLVNDQQTAGYKSVQWNATDNLGQPVSAGLYLYTIQAGQFKQTKKMILLK